MRLTRRTNPNPDLEGLIRRLALNDTVAIAAVLGPVDDESLELGARTAALVRLAALIAVQSAGTSYQWAVGTALAAGATEDEVIDVLAAVAPIVGSARVAAAVPELAAALGIAPVQP